MFVNSYLYYKLCIFSYKKLSQIYLNSGSYRIYFFIYMSCDIDTSFDTLTYDTCNI